MSELVFYIICIIGAFVWLFFKSQNAPQYIDWIREESEKR